MDQFEIGLKELHKTSSFHRKTLSDDCSCFYCHGNFKKTEILEWTDDEQTAICPECDVDAVISKASPELLTEMHNYFFSRN